jgi:hypothetical protein
LCENNKNSGNQNFRVLKHYNPQNIPLNEIQSILSKELAANKSNSSRIFQVFDELFKVESSLQLQRLDFFSDALLKVIANLLKSFNKDHFVKLCFYVSFYKKNNPGPKIVKRLFNQFLDKSLDHKLTTLDVAIISLTSFKSSVNIQNERFHQRVLDEFVSTNEDDEFLLVALLKYLLFNRIKDDKILIKLKSLNYSKHEYNPLIHIIPYLADNKISDNELAEKIVKRCIETFNSSSRVKDIQRMLHSCALINFKIDTKHLENIERMIVAATKNEEYNNHFDHYVNSALSLWIMDYQCVNLAKILLNDSRFYKHGPNSRIKLDSRMKLLETCIEIESPELIKNIKYKSFEETRPAPGFLVKPSLEKVMTEKFKDQKSARFVHQIKNLNTAGILVSDENGNRTHYEVLDKLTTLDDKITPSGFFELKLRLLRKLGCKVEVVKGMAD